MTLQPGQLALWILFGILPILAFILGLRAPGVRRQGPIILAFFAGIIPILSLYIPKVFLGDPEVGMSPRLDKYLIIVAGFALPLGIVNVIQNNSRRAARREKGWPYAVVLLIGLFVTGALGVFGAVSGEGIGFRSDGTSTPFKWIEDNAFRPLQATIFALLAFFMASAAFRAFRARNTEATILLVAGLLVMLGRVPLLEFLATPFPALMPAAAEGSLRLGQLTEWIMNVPNSAAQAGIIIGAALGAAAMAIRVILGIERSYLGLEKGE
jgi:hypothetical protein